MVSQGRAGWWRRARQGPGWPRLAAQGRNVGVNLSARSVGDLGLLRHIEMQFNAAGVDPSLVTFEITETALMENLEAGERFARGLADMVTRGGGRLDSFFLDEGFGNLDPEHIERAMRGIEHLVHDGGERLVVLVSHVEQMHDLLEDLIVLDKADVTGDTIVVRGALPAV